MAKYTLDFKYRAVKYYQQERSQQRTADHFKVSRTHLRRWIAAYNTGGIRALQNPQAAAMQNPRKNPFIVDKPDNQKTPAELIEEVRYLRAENDYLKKIKALSQTEATAKKAKPSKD